MVMLRGTSIVRLLVFAAGVVLANGPAGAQVRYVPPAGYPTSPQLGPGGYGGGGLSTYPVGGYHVYRGQVGPGYLGASRLQQPSAAPQTTIVLQPLYNAITSIPGWYGPAAKPHPRQPARPKVPRDQLLDAEGKILWPSATPGDPSVIAARRAAEEAVGAVVREEKAYGHATVRHVVEAKNKLVAFEKPALKELWARNAADASGLESFLYELGKTLETMALNY